MKKMRLIALVLVLSLLFSVPAAAAVGDKVESDRAVVEIKNADTTVSFDSTNAEIIKVTVTSTALKAGSQYVILMVKRLDGENYTIDVNSILYIDQKAAEGSGNKATIGFDVYPSSMSDGIILIAGADGGPLTLAIVDGGIIGDMDGNGQLDILDVLMLLRISVGIIEDGEYDKSACDLVADGAIDILDVLLLLRAVVGLVEL